MKNRVISVIISALLIFSVFCTVSADVENTDDMTVSVSDFNGLKSALAAAVSGQTILLLSDIEITSKADIKYLTGSNTLTIDLNGHTLTFSPGSDAVKCAIFINYCWRLNIVNSSESTGGFINNSSYNFFNTNGGSSLCVSGYIKGNLSNNAGIYFNDCTVDGSVKASGNAEILAGKYLNVTGDFTASALNVTRGLTDAVITVGGSTVIAKNAVIFDNSVFNGPVSIGKDYTATSSSSLSTTVYGGEFKGTVDIGVNVDIQNAAGAYSISIRNGSFYDKTAFATKKDGCLGKVSAAIYDGSFFKDAFITSDNINIYRGSFSYSFYDESDVLLKAVTVKRGSVVYPPTVPKKDGYTFIGWEGYTEGMTVSTTCKFKAQYTEGDDADQSKYEPVSADICYTKKGIAVEPAKSIYTDIATPDKTLSKENGAEVASSAGGLSDYIPATNGDMFRVSSIRTDIYESKAFGAAYDSDKNVIAVFVENELSTVSFKGRRSNRYSIGLTSEKRFHFDVDFQIPAKETGSMFENIAYIRVIATKESSTTPGLQYIHSEDDFYVAYLGNKYVSETPGEVSHLSQEDTTVYSNVVGDLDNNGTAAEPDALYMEKYLSKYDGYKASICNADLNYDGKINIKDYVYHKRAIENYDGYTLEKPKFIALSFDDAPGSIATVLPVFENYHKDFVRATYMINGNRVSPDKHAVLLRAKELGLDFGNHSTFHDRGIIGTKCLGEIRSEINFTQDIIYNLLGQTNSYFRAPFFAVTAEMKEALADMIFIEGTGSSDTTTSVTAEASAATQLRQAANGNIILLHDNGKLPDTLKILIPALLEQGYKLVTIDEIFKYNNITPQKGYTYTNVFKGSKK